MKIRGSSRNLGPKDLNKKKNPLQFLLCKHYQKNLELTSVLRTGHNQDKHVSQPVAAIGR